MCGRCFADLAPGAEFCEECGAPVADDPGSEGSDAAIYPELARANLLRMRGDFKGAEDVCLGILRRYPNNATANGLLGDICAEKGDLAQAAEWFELALDLTPDDEAVQQKLANVQSRMKEHEAAETAKQLGLPTSRPKVGLYIIGVIVFLVAIGIVAFSLGKQAEKKSLADRGIVNAPVTIDPAPANPPSQSAPPDTGQAPVPATTTATEDERAAMRQILGAMAENDPTKTALLEVRVDPRTESGGPIWTLTYEVKADQDPKALGSALALGAFHGSTEVNGIVLRALRLGKLVYLASVGRGDETGVTIQNEWSSEKPPTEQPEGSSTPAGEAPPDSSKGAQGQ